MISRTPTINNSWRSSCVALLLLTSVRLCAENRAQAPADSSGTFPIVALYYDSLWYSGQLSGMVAWEEISFPRLVKDTSGEAELTVSFSDVPPENPYSVESEPSLITIERFANGDKNTSGTMQIKWLHDEAGEIILGISLVERNAWRGWAHAAAYFFVLHNGEWTKLPDPVPFSEESRFVPKKSNARLLKKYAAVTALIKFYDASDGITVTPLVREDLNCEKQWDSSWNASKELGIKSRDLKKICAALKQVDKREFSCRWSTTTRKYTEIR